MNTERVRAALTSARNLIWDLLRKEPVFRAFDDDLDTCDHQVKDIAIYLGKYFLDMETLGQVITALHELECIDRDAKETQQ